MSHADVPYVHPNYLGGTICWIRDKQEGTPPKENQLIHMTSASKVVTALEGFQFLFLAATLTSAERGSFHSASSTPDLHSNYSSCLSRHLPGPLLTPHPLWNGKQNGKCHWGWKFIPPTHTLHLYHRLGSPEVIRRKEMVVSFPGDNG